MRIEFGRQPFHYLFVPTVLPFAEGGYDIDESALRRYLERLSATVFASRGVGVVINSEAGELVYLSRKEARRTVEIAVEVCAGRIPVVAGVAALRPETMIEIAQDAKDVGAEALMLLPPMGAVDVSVGWNTARYPEVWTDVAAAVDAAVDMPLFMHPVTNFTPEFGPGFPVVGVMKMVEEIENVVAWKMTYSWQGWRTVAAALRGFRRHIALLGSGARYYHEAIASGILDGGLSAAFNYSLDAHLAAHCGVPERQSRDCFIHLGRRAPPAAGVRVRRIVAPPRPHQDRCLDRWQRSAPDDASADAEAFPG